MDESFDLNYLKYMSIFLDITLISIIIILMSELIYTSNKFLMIVTGILFILLIVCIILTLLVQVLIKIESEDETISSVQRLKKIRNMFITDDILIMVIIIISVFGLVLLNHICLWFVNIFLFILFGLLLLITWIINSFFKVYKEVETLPEEQQEERFEEVFKDSVIMKLLSKLDEFMGGEKLKESQVQKVLLNDDGLNFVDGDQTVFQIVPWFDIKKVRFWGKVRHGCNYLFILKDGNRFYLSTPFTKEPGELFLKKIRNNLKLQRAGQPIDSEEYSGNFAYKYFEKME